jgi:hypothetical protein
MTEANLTKPCRPVGNLSGGRQYICCAGGNNKIQGWIMPLEPYDSKSSAHVIRQVEKWQKKLLKKYRTRIVYLADEFYIMAGEKLPDMKNMKTFHR